MVPPGGWRVKLRRGSVRKRAKGAGESSLRQAFQELGANRTGKPPKIAKGSCGFSEDRGFRLLRGGGEQSGQVCIVIVKMPPGKAGQRAIFPAENTSSHPPPSASTQRKTKMGSCLPARMPGGGGAPSVLTLRKAKCTASRPHG